MIVHTAYLTCRTELLAEFRSRLLQHAANSVEKEEGCIKFAIHQDRNKPERFLLVEHYADEGALEAHRNAEHYLRFREDVADWVVQREWWFWDLLN